MTAPQRLDRTLYCYRIGDPEGKYPIVDATGSRLYPGRWNTAAAPLVYASESYSTAMLEKLVHGAGHLPPNQHFVCITLPRGTSYEIVTGDRVPGWAADEPVASREFGTRWVRESRSLVLFVPSYVARVERNVLLNPAHVQYGDIETSLPEPVWWDERLFRGRTTPGG